MLGNRSLIRIPTDDDLHKLPYVTECTGVLLLSSVVLASSGVLVDLLVYTDGINDVTVTIYDNPSTSSGKVLAKMTVKGSENVGGEVSIFTKADNGLYAQVVGTNAQALVRYIPLRT